MWYKLLNCYDSTYNFALAIFLYHVNFCWYDMIQKIERNFTGSVGKEVNSVVVSVEKCVDAILTAMFSVVIRRL